MLDVEDRVKACYSTWGRSYYDDYYGPNAAYPPVHRELIRRLLLQEKVVTLLDAGCGPASLLRDLAEIGLDRYGFDLTPEMVAEARRVLVDQGVPEAHIWQGSVLSSESFRVPHSGFANFDAAVCIGVFPHVPPESDLAVLLNLRSAVRPGGLVVVEARNQLFSLFTFNRYSCDFVVNELIRASDLRDKVAIDINNLDGALNTLQSHFRLDLPPIRTGKAGEPGYDEVLSRTHNPLVIQRLMSDNGFCDVRLLFYHYHCLPPMLATHVPEFFRRESLSMENPEDWRGYFMASAFLAVGRRT